MKNFQVDQSYFVDCDQDNRDNISNNFYVEPMKISKLGPGTKLLIKLCYRPVFPNKISRSNFVLMRADGQVLNITLKGTSVGKYRKSKQPVLLYR